MPVVWFYLHKDDHFSLTSVFLALLFQGRDAPVFVEQSMAADSRAWEN
jgi:hypothetical protein